MGVPVYRTASTVPQYTDISLYRYTPNPFLDILTFGYRFPCRADNAAYPHDGRADKRCYRHDRRADSQCRKIAGKVTDTDFFSWKSRVPCWRALSTDTESINIIASGVLTLALVV